MKRFFSKNKIFFLSYLFIFILSFPTYSTLLNINPTFSNVSQHSIERKSDTIGYTKQLMEKNTNDFMTLPQRNGLLIGFSYKVKRKIIC